jgi:hypothetical protein
MLIFFGIINQQERIMTERDALVAIHAIFGVAEGKLNDGGFELNEREYGFIRVILKKGLKIGNEASNVQD